jgi:hypothetical protein
VLVTGRHRAITASQCGQCWSKDGLYRNRRPKAPWQIESRAANRHALGPPEAAMDFHSPRGPLKSPYEPLAADQLTFL